VWWSLSSQIGCVIWIKNLPPTLLFSFTGTLERLSILASWGVDLSQEEEVCRGCDHGKHKQRQTRRLAKQAGNHLTLLTVIVSSDIHADSAAKTVHTRILGRQTCFSVIFRKTGNPQASRKSCFPNAPLQDA
jgi:hypothetical protein